MVSSIVPCAKDCLQGKRVLVTGGRGFIGATLTSQLRALDAEVFTVGRSRPIADTFFDRVANLQDHAATTVLFDDLRPDYVIHLASHVVGARTPDVVLSTLQSNLISTVNLLLAATQTGCRRVILTGSLEEPEPASDWPVPSSPYAAAKLGAGAYGRMFNALFALPVVILRVFMVYGPGQHDLRKLVPYTISCLLRNEEPRYSSGTREVDWIFVDDVARAFIHALIAPDVDGRTLDIGSGELAPVRHVVERIHALMHAKSAPAFGGAEDRAMEQVRKADIANTAQGLGWTPTVALDDGLKETIAWYSAHL